MLLLALLTAFTSGFAHAQSNDELISSCKLTEVKPALHSARRIQTYLSQLSPLNAWAEFTANFTDPKTKNDPRIRCYHDGKVSELRSALKAHLESQEKYFASILREAAPPPGGTPSEEKLDLPLSFLYGIQAVANCCGQWPERDPLTKSWHDKLKRQLDPWIEDVAARKRNQERDREWALLKEHARTHPDHYLPNDKFNDDDAKEKYFSANCEKARTLREYCRTYLLRQNTASEPAAMPTPWLNPGYSYNAPRPKLERLADQDRALVSQRSKYEGIDGSKFPENPCGAESSKSGFHPWTLSKQSRDKLTDALKQSCGRFAPKISD